MKSRNHGEGLLFVFLLFWLAILIASGTFSPKQLILKLFIVIGK